MDYTILYIFLAIGVAFGLAYSVAYLRRKNIVNQDDLKLAMQMLDIGMRVVSELRLDKEVEILKIADIVKDSLEYAISMYDIESDVINNAYIYSLELCEKMNVELTETRKELLMDLIIIVFNDNYIQFIKN